MVLYSGLLKWLTLGKYIHCQDVYNTFTDSLFTNIGIDCAAHCLGENLTTVEAQL